MAIEVTVTGSGQFAGAASNVGGYSVREESTSVVASDTGGAVGEITFPATDDPGREGSMLLYQSDVRLVDGDRGETVGTITDLSGRDGTVTVTAVPRLGKLVVNKTATYVNGTFDSAIRYYLSLGGITTDIAVDSSLASIPVIAPGWTGDLWTKIKELCVYAGAEISLVKGVVVIRKVRGRRALELNNINLSWSVSKTDVAREIEVFYYNTQYLSGGLVYPYGGWNDEVQVYSVDAGQTLRVNIPVNVSLSSIEAPVAVDSVDRTYSASSVYAVSGNDGHAIPAQMWADYGGRLTASVGADKQSIDLRITGAKGSITKYAPFRIAMSAGPSDYYSSLRIVGTGVGFNKESVIIPTAANPAEVTRDVGVSVDLPFVRTQAQAYDIGLDVTAKWSAPERKITVTKADIRKPGETDENYHYATFSDFDEEFDGLLFSDFDALFTGQTFKDFDNYWYQKAKDEFDFQIFGNASGSRIQYRRAMYRIRDVTTTESTVNYTAEADTIFADFDTAAEGMTFEDFDALYDGMTFAEYGLIPLATAPPEYDRD